MKNKTVVFYYSRTGTTQKVATEVAKGLGAQLIALVDRQDRKGLVGYLRSGFDATLHRLTTLEDLHEEARDADLWVIGTPVWSASLSAPVSTFLRYHRGHTPALAFFLTEGGRGGPRVLQQMEQESGEQPRATLILSMGEVQGNRHAGKVQAFVEKLSASQAIVERPRVAGTVTAASARV